MSKLDLSAFRKNFVRDTEEDLKEIDALKQSVRIPEGIHEVVAVGIHEKDKIKYKLIDKVGGSLGFSLVFEDAKKRSQMFYMTIPLAVTFKLACMDSDKKVSFPFIKTQKFLRVCGVDLIKFREALINTEEAAECLIGTQFVVTNTWPDNKLHLEYDGVAKAFYFTNSSNERFSSGELAAPIELPKGDKDSRFSEAIVIASQNGYQLATQMESDFSVHPTAVNNKINELISKFLTPKKEIIINKTIPAFAVKKPTGPLSHPDADVPDFDCGE